MRLLVWMFKGLWGGSIGSLVGALLLLIAGIAAFYFMVLPYFKPPLSLSEDELAEMSIPPSSLQRIKLEGDLVDGNRRGTVDDEFMHLGILEFDNHLLLVASLEALPEGDGEYLGRFASRDPQTIDHYEAIVDDENLNGRPITAVFVLGEASQSTVFAYFILDGILLGLGLVGLLRFIMLRMQKA